MKQSVYIIAEAGVNHNGSIDMAKELIRVAARSGADAIKFQTFKSERLVTQQAEKAAYQKRVSGEETQYNMLKKLELSEEDHHVLIACCMEEGIDFLSTPFDELSLRFLTDQCGILKVKLSSGDLTNGPLLWKVALTGLPVILSTGMGTLGEVEEALSVLACGYVNGQLRPTDASIREAYRSDEGQLHLKEKVTLLHCTTEYPTPVGEVNLKAMTTLEAAFGLPVGLSDHTAGTAAATASIALGAQVIEKHFTLDKLLPGPDHQASLNPEELQLLVSAIRQVERAMGTGRKLPSCSEIGNMAITRKSLVAAVSVTKGEPWTVHNLTTKRPGSGKSPMLYWDMLGRLADKDYEADELLQ